MRKLLEEGQQAKKPFRTRQQTGSVGGAPTLGYHTNLHKSLSSGKTQKSRNSFSPCLRRTAAATGTVLAIHGVLTRDACFPSAPWAPGSARASISYQKIPRKLS